MGLVALLRVLILSCLFIGILGRRLFQKRGRGKTHRDVKFRGLDFESYSIMSTVLPELKKEMCKHFKHGDCGAVDMVSPMSTPDDGTLVGDLAVTGDEALALYQEMTGHEFNLGYDRNVDLVRRKRAIVPKTAARWPKDQPIYYILDSNYDEDEADLIHSVLQDIEDKTCLEFMFDQNDTETEQQRLLVQKDPGCWSYLGFQNRPPESPQVVNLGNGCMVRGIVYHEVLHALGIEHEHTRQDRDGDITINWDNIQDNAIGQYAIQGNGLTFGLPLDLASVMMYRKTAFQNGTEPTMTVNKPWDNLTDPMIGSRAGASFYDYKLVNLGYDCPNECLSGPDCTNAGFTSSKNCSECICPEGMGGEDCSLVAESSDGCTAGDTWNVTHEEQCVTTPYYGDLYNIGDTCAWKLQAPSGSRIDIYFRDFFRVVTLWNMCFHWVEVKFKPNLSERGIRFCGYNDEVETGDYPPPVTNPVTSEGDVAMVIFDAEYQTNSQYRQGAKICFKIHDDVCAHTNPCLNQGVCSEPVYPNYMCDCASTLYTGENCDILTFTEEPATNTEPPTTTAQAPLPLGCTAASDCGENANCDEGACVCNPGFGGDPKVSCKEYCTCEFLGDPLLSTFEGILELVAGDFSFFDIGVCGLSSRVFLASQGDQLYPVKLTIRFRDLDITIWKNKTVEYQDSSSTLPDIVTLTDTSQVIPTHPDVKLSLENGYALVDITCNGEPVQVGFDPEGAKTRGVVVVPQSLADSIGQDPDSECGQCSGGITT